jgi:tripartite-type tricarboxylate transporter receptor subunit TctC
MGLAAVSYSGWYGFFAPSGTPKDIIAKLNAAAVAALADPAVQSRLADLGLEIFPRERQTPEALGALVKADAKKWWPLIKDFGIAAEKAYPVDSGSATCCGLNDRIRSVAGTTIDG